MIFIKSFPYKCMILNPRCGTVLNRSKDLGIKPGQ